VRAYQSSSAEGIPIPSIIAPGLARAAGGTYNDDMPRALVVDDDQDFRDAVEAVVAETGFAIESASTLAEARSLLGRRTPDVAFVDQSLPDGNGLELLQDLEGCPATEVVVITGHATVNSVIGAFRGGVADYLTKPVDVRHLRSILASVARRLELSEEIATLRGELRELGRFGPLIGASPAMQAIYDLIGRVAPTDATVLLQGESGTGKEVAAKTIHQLSRRRNKPLVVLNCGAVSPQLIESELFGHERGSFTGADRSHRGFFERAAGGTLFLDEITEMHAELQVKLLRALESGSILRVGGEHETPVDVRVIAATNRDPDEAVEEGKLRRDLLYRLRVFPIHLPPLRARAGDVDLLADDVLASLNRAESTSKHLGRAARAALRGYHWPGNVRELQNAMRTAFILADEDITPACLPQKIREGPSPAETVAAEGAVLQVRVGTAIAEVERRLILATLAACDGKKEHAAAVLGISLKTLYNRLHAFRGSEAPAQAAGSAVPAHGTSGSRA
jgi:two-component system response regulator AtoC